MLLEMFLFTSDEGCGCVKVVYPYFGRQVTAFLNQHFQKGRSGYLATKVT
jgi:hypothetical protein